MATAPTSRDRHEFRFGLGHPVLEFVATRAGRLGDPLERLETPSDLSSWLELSRVAGRARCDEETLGQARQLREAIYRMLTAARNNQRAGVRDRRVVNSWARRPTPSPQLGPNMQLRSTGPDPCRAALAQLARAAIELVAGSDLPRIRDCANPGCSLMFIDHSRPGRRRWCSMERCGNRAKTARYRRRRRRHHP